MVVMVMHVREVRINKTVLLNLAHIWLMTLRNVHLGMLILHSFILTLITWVIFFQFVIFVRLCSLYRQAVILALSSYLLYFVEVLPIICVLHSLFVLF